MERKGSKQLYSKLLRIYTAVMVGVVLALMVYFLKNTKDGYLERNVERLNMMQQESVLHMQNMESIASVLHEELYKSNMEINDLLHLISDSPEGYQRYRLDAYSEYAQIYYRGIDDFIVNAFEAYDQLKRIAFFSYDKGDMVYFSGNQLRSYKKDGSQILDRIRSGDMADPGEFSYLKEIRDPVTMQSEGAMIITFSTEQFEKLKAYYQFPDLIIFNEQETLVYDSSNLADPGVLKIARQEGKLEAYLKAYIRSNSVGNYTLISCIQKSEAADIPGTAVLMIVAVACLALLIGEILVRTYLHRLQGRLNGILDGMTKVMGGDMSIRLASNKNGDELDVIARHFNEMCEKLDLHIQKSYLAQIEQKNAEMSALQSQINPHFLYNTLEAIRMKAICNGDREVGKMLYSMAVTFRSQIKEADVITLAQELHYCKKYLELFEYRYPGQFQSSVECPLEYMNVPIIKFVLQPIIENYFIHGIRMQDKDNRIWISVEKAEEEYHIIVEDNGRGMTEEEIKEKNQRLAENKAEMNRSIGMMNVNRRLKAVYGNRYGVTVEKGAEKGMKVILRFKPEKGEQDEKSNDSGR